MFVRCVFVWWNPEKIVNGDWRWKIFVCTGNFRHFFTFISTGIIIVFLSFALFSVRFFSFSISLCPCLCLSLSSTLLLIIFFLVVYLQQMQNMMKFDEFFYHIQRKTKINDAFLCDCDKSSTNIAENILTATRLNLITPH